MDWLVLQLADSAFPAGSFAHSCGLEAMAQAGELRGRARVEAFVRELAWQTGHAALPLASAAHEMPASLALLDARADAFLVNHVANRASRQQGRAFIQTCAHAFPNVRALRDEVRAAGLKQHHAPIFGAALRRLDVPCADMQRLLLFGTVRAGLSSAVRLALLGTHEAQELQATLPPLLDEVLTACAPLRADDVAQTAPLADLLQATHDGLYSRLFLS
jgi:urease accessory protein